MRQQEERQFVHYQIFECIVRQRQAEHQAWAAGMGLLLAERRSRRNATWSRTAARRLRAAAERLEASTPARSSAG